MSATCSEISGQLVLNGRHSLKTKDENFAVDSQKSKAVKEQQIVSPVWMGASNFNGDDSRESVNNKIMVVHLPTPCSTEREAGKETLIAAVNQQLEEPFVMVDVEIANKKIENVPLSYDCRVCDIKDKLAANETVRVVFYLYEHLQKQELQRCAIEDSELFVKVRPGWKFIILEELVEDPNMTICDAFGDMLSSTRLTFIIAGKPLSAALSTTSSESMVGIEGEQLKNDVKEDLRALIRKYSLAELAAANCPLSKGLLLQIQKEKYLSCISAEKQKAFKVWLADFKVHEKAVEAAKVVKTETTAKPSPVHSFLPPSQAYYTKQPSEANVPDITHQQHPTAIRIRSDRGPRYRTSFDPVTELPMLRSWFQNNSSPDSNAIQQYTSILNSREGRGTKRPLDEYSIKIWFKNARAKRARESSQIEHEPVKTFST